MLDKAEWLHLLRTDVAAFNRARKAAGLEVRPDLTGVDLSGMDLDDADLSFFDLSNANLSGATVSPLVLAMSRLENTNLSNVKARDPQALEWLRLLCLLWSDIAAFNAQRSVSPILTTSDLSRADLSGADLAHAMMSGAHLAGAKLSRANLEDALMMGANLDGACFAGNQTLARVTFAGAMLRAADLSDTELSFVELRGADAGGARFDRARFRMTNLSGLLATKASFAGATFTKLHFDDAILIEADFTNARFDRVTFLNCDLAGARFDGATATALRFSGCDLAGVNLRAIAGTTPELANNTNDAGTRGRYEYVVALTHRLSLEALPELLAELHDDGWIEEVQRSWDTQDEVVRLYIADVAEQGLAALGAGAREAVTSLLKTAGPGVRVRATRILGRGALDVLPVLAATIRDPAVEVRVAGTIALAAALRRYAEHSPGTLPDAEATARHWDAWLPQNHGWFRALADRLLDPNPAVIEAGRDALDGFRAVGSTPRPFEPAVRAALESLVADHPDAVVRWRER